MISRWTVATFVAVSIVFAGCSSTTGPGPGGSAPAPQSARPGSSSPAPASATQPAIVGEWVGVHDCRRIVGMLTDAGLQEFLPDAVYGNGLLPGDPQASGLANPTNPCDGAIQRPHSHFFTAAGEFGSKDFNGQPVDDGSYTLEGDDVLVISGERFKYRIDGELLSLEPEPVDISGCTTKDCRFRATWVLMVAMPGTSWKRGEIKPQ